MKKTLQILIAGIIIFVLPGCLEIKTIVNVNPDGSGTVEETMLMSQEMVEMMSGFAGSFSEDSTGNVEEFSLFNEEELKDKSNEFGPAVKFVSAEEIKVNGRSGYKAVYSFQNLNELHINQNPGSKISMGMPQQQTEDKTNYVTFQFKKGNPSVITIDLPEPKPDDDDEEIPGSTEDDSLSSAEMDSDSFNQMAALFKGLRISMLLNIKGSIVETNASYRNGSTVTLLDLNFGELLKNKEKLEELKDVNPADIQEVKELLKGITGMQLEFNDPVTIKFN